MYKKKATPSQVDLPIIDKRIVNNNSICPVTLIRGLISLLLDMNFAGPFLMIFDRPNVPETMEVMNENQKKAVVVSIPESLLGKIINRRVKCNCGMDSTKGSAKDLKQ